MSILQVTKIVTVDNTTPLILATGNAGGGQIIIQSSNTDVMFNGNINFSNYVTGDGSGLYLPTSDVANAAFNTANACFAVANTVDAQIKPAFDTANAGYGVANTALQNTANIAFAGSLFFPNGRVGIGTTTPSANLQVVGNANVSGAVISATGFWANRAGGQGYVLLQQDGAGGGQIRSNTGAGLRFTDNSSAIDWIHINGNGNVAIGAASSSLYKLYVNAGANGTQLASVTGSAGGTALPLDLYGGDSAAALVRLRFGTFANYFANNSYIETQTATATTSDMRFGVSGVERMRIATGGNVGIGTTVPVTRLHVSDGNTSISSALYTSDFVTISGQEIAPGFNIIAAANTGDNRGVFKATRARGTLSSPLVPILDDDTFTLLGTIYDGAVGRATAAVNMEVDGTVSSGVAPQRLTFWTGPTNTRVERMRIDATGNVGIGTTSPSAKLHVVSGTNMNAGGVLDMNAASILVGTVASGIGIDANQIESTSSLHLNYNSTDSITMGVGGGNVGIGNTSPLFKLHVTGTAQLGSTRIENSSSNPILSFWSGGSFFCSVGTVAGIIGSGTSTDLGLRADTNRNIRFYTNGANERVVIDTSGNVSIGQTSTTYKLQVNGSFAANTKSFVIDHPTKPGMKLRYGSLEGPENGVYVRGKIDGTNVITLPDYWEGLVDLDSITVNLTAIGRSQNPYVSDIDGLKIYIDTENHTQPHCYYHVYAERKDVEKLVVEF